MRWNFAKFLIDHEGKAYKRYSPTIKPDDLRADIEYLLQCKKESDAPEEERRAKKAEKLAKKKAKQQERLEKKLSKRNKTRKVTDRGWME